MEQSRLFDPVPVAAVRLQWAFLAPHRTHTFVFSSAVDNGTAPIELGLRLTASRAAPSSGQT